MKEMIQALRTNLISLKKMTTLMTYLKSLRKTKPEDLGHPLVQKHLEIGTKKLISYLLSTQRPMLLRRL